eukprot:3632731-Rhodomonas_salina.1
MQCPVLPASEVLLAYAPAMPSPVLRSDTPTPWYQVPAIQGKDTRSGGRAGPRCQRAGELPLPAILYCFQPA